MAAIDIEMIILFAIIFVVAPIIKIIDKALTKRWKQDLMDFKIATEVITIYHNYKKNEDKKVSWTHQKFEDFKKRIKTYFAEKKQKRYDKIHYGG